MKVLKFGGTSVGTATALRNLREIVEHQERPVIVVVSALRGVTDSLIRTAQTAARGDSGYRAMFDDLVLRHRELINEALPEQADALRSDTEPLLAELASIFCGVYLIRDLSAKTQAAIVSYGERLSSRIVASLLPHSVLHDARRFIKTEPRDKTRHDSQGVILDSTLTRRLITEEFNAENLRHAIHVVPGFIASDSVTGEVTNLGRGGSDYTAAIIAAALDAEALEIWTDVDGFMTADPKVIPTAYTITRLSYLEAMELCNFGARVIYPPTIYPVCVKDIPILVKNTFNPDGPGTVITKESVATDKVIRGISSIGGTSLITVTGLSMVGVIGVNRRIFTALAQNGISVFMVSQASSENSTSIAVRDQDATEAAAVLNKEFADEIADGAMYPMFVEKGLATIAVVGENMRHTPGIAGKLFGTLGRNGINVISFAQGAKQTNISFTVRGENLRKSLNVIHDSFFLSEYKEINLFVCGVGVVGNMLLEQIRSQRDTLLRTHRLKAQRGGDSLQPPRHPGPRGNRTDRLPRAA